jgi:hypothetical protein
VALTPRLPIVDRRQQALGWQVWDDGIRMHGGGTGGFSAAVLIDPGHGRAVAMLATAAGYASALGQAALLALADENPRAARPEPPGPEWDERAREIVQSLVDGRTGDVHARATAGFKAQVPAERLDRVWRERTRDLGPAGEVTVTCRRAGGRVVADVGIAFGSGPLALRMAFEPSGAMGGLRILQPQEEPPPLPELLKFVQDKFIDRLSNYNCASEPVAVWGVALSYTASTTAPTPRRSPPSV